MARPTPGSGPAAPGPAAEDGRRAAAGVVLAALASRVAWVLLTAGTGPLFDKYFWLARRLQGVGWLPDVAFTSSPLYTYLFALLAVGLGWGETAIRLLQAVAGAGAVGLAWLAFRDLAGERVALAGALLLALHPTVVLYDTQPLPEAWINLGNGALLLGLARLDRGRPALRAALLGAGAGLSVLLRPTALLWLPLIALRLIGLRRGGAGALARAAAACALAFAAAVAPAAWINARAEGRLILSTTAGGLNLYNGNNRANRGYTFLSPPSVKRLEGLVAGAAVRQPITPEHLAWQRAASWAAGRELSLAESSDFWVGEVRAYAAREPGAFLAGLARKARFFLHGAEPHDTESAAVRGRRFGPYGFWLPALLWALALVGLALALPRRRGLLAPCGLLAAYAGSCALLYVSSRLRVPAVLPAALFAGVAVAEAREALALRRRRRLAALAAAAAAALALTAWPHRLVRETERVGAVTIELVQPGMERYRRGDAAGALDLLGRAAAAEPLLAGTIAGMLEAAGPAPDPAVRGFVDRLYARSLEAGGGTEAAVGARIRAAAARLREAGPEPALAEIDAALALDPWNWDLHNARGTLLARLGRWEEALAALERGFALGRNVQPDVGEAWLDLARAALAAGRRERARECLRGALLVDPRSAEALRLQAALG